MPDETLRHTLPGGELPEPMDLFQDTWKEFSDDMTPYVMAGLGQLLVVLPIVFVLIFAIYIGMFATMFGGLFIGAIAGALVGEVAGEEAGGLVFFLTYMLSLLMMFGAILFVSMVASAVLAPLNASLVRRVAQHQRGERTLDFQSTFTDATENIFSVILLSFLVGFVIMVGLMFFYLPGLIAAFVLVYAGSLVYLHGVSPLSAMKTSAKHFTQNLQFHGLFTLLYFGTAMIASYVPIVGPMFLLALHVRAHRTLFGDGLEPVIEHVPKQLTASEA